MNLSPSEERLLGLLPRDGQRVSTKDLLKKFYRGRVVPQHGQIVISGLVRSLVQKTRTSEVRVCRSRRAGPRPVKVWTEKRIDI
jgi:hypothetical protein